MVSIKLLCAVLIIAMLGEVGFAFNCLDITDETICMAHGVCAWSGPWCFNDDGGSSPSDSSCFAWMTEGTCTLGGCKYCSTSTTICVGLNSECPLTSAELKTKCNLLGPHGCHVDPTCKLCETTGVCGSLVDYDINICPCSTIVVKSVCAAQNYCGWASINHCISVDIMCGLGVNDPKCSSTGLLPSHISCFDNAADCMNYPKCLVDGVECKAAYIICSSLTGITCGDTDGCTWCDKTHTCITDATANDGLCKYCASGSSSTCNTLTTITGTTACSWCEASSLCYDSVSNAAACAYTDTLLNAIPGDVFLYPPSSTMTWSATGGKLVFEIDLLNHASRSVTSVAFQQRGNIDLNLNPAITSFAPTVPAAGLGQIQNILEITIDDLIKRCSPKQTYDVISDGKTGTTYDWSILISWTETVAPTTTGKRDYTRAVDEMFNYQLFVPTIVTADNSVTIVPTETIYTIISRAMISIPMSVTGAKMDIEFITKPTFTTGIPAIEALYINPANMLVSSVSGQVLKTIAVDQIINTEFIAGPVNLQKWKVSLTLTNPCTILPTDGFTLSIQLSDIANPSVLHDSEIIYLPFVLHSIDFCALQTAAITFAPEQDTYLTGTAFDNVNDPKTTLFWLNDEVYVRAHWTTTSSISVKSAVVTSVVIKRGQTVVADEENLLVQYTAIGTTLDACKLASVCYKFTTNSEVFSKPTSITGDSIQIITTAELTLPNGLARNVRSFSTKSSNASSAIRLFSNATTTSDTVSIHSGQFTIVAIVVSAMSTLLASFF